MSAKVENNCVCQVCGEGFFRFPSAIKRGGGRFCGKPCQGRGSRTKKLTLTCKKCGRPIERKSWRVRGRTFCTKRCERTRHTDPIIMNDDGLTARVPLHTHDGSVNGYAVIDAADAGWIGQHQWYLDSNGYAARNPGILLHREVLGLKRGNRLFGDHINGDTLDDRKANLRPAPPDLSAQNLLPRVGGSSQYRGVSWDARRGLWRAMCNVGGKTVYRQHFSDETEAAEAAREARARFMPFATN